MTGEPTGQIKTKEVRRLVRLAGDKQGAAGAKLQAELTESLIEIGIKEEIFKTLFVGPVVRNVTESLSYSVNASERDVQSKARRCVELAEKLQQRLDMERIYQNQCRALELHTGESLEINLNAVTNLIVQGDPDDE